ncbi:MAG: sigma-70 family RNA polymerase sigma factor [Planctomycetaceae bacterium]|nr:sigma-70 family RNA polymerase sigma factor [Planctomycetaceae bacterium]
MKERDDDFSALMRLVREGSEDAAWQVVEQYGEAVRRAVRRALDSRLRSKFDTVDFVQVVWGSLFRVREKVCRFDRPEELTAYLIAMARNKVGMEVRRRIASQKYDVAHERSLDELHENGHEMTSKEPNPIDVAVAREKWKQLLESQPQRYREIIPLRLQGLTCQGIAERLHVDQRTVRRLLKKLLGAAAA